MRNLTTKMFVVLIGLTSAGFANAEIASKAYVDTQDAKKADKLGSAASDFVAYVDKTTGQYVRSTLTVTDLSGAAGSVTGKADKVDSATDGNLAGLDASGNLTDSGVSADDLVTTTNIDTVLEGSTTITNITTILGDVEDLEADLAGKADLQGTGTAGLIATVDADGQYVRSSIAATDVVTKSAVETILGGSTTITNIEGDVTNIQTILGDVEDLETELGKKEDKSNKTDDVETNKASSDKYASAKGVATYVGAQMATLGDLAKAAPGECADTESKCVLTFDGEDYGWEVVER